LRICFLIPDQPSQGVNGPTRDALHTARAMVEADHEAHVIGYGEDTAVSECVDGVWRHRITVADGKLPELADVPVATELYTAVAKYRAVMRLHTQSPVDLVVATPWPGESLVCLLDRRLTVVTSLVTSVKFMTDTGLLAGEPWLMMGRLERAVIARSRYFSASSAAIVSDTESTFGLHLPAVTPTPFGTADRAHSVTRAERPASPEDVVVLSVGRCEPRKGADVLLAAAQRLASEVRNVVYVFVGAGGWDALRTQVEQDARLRDHVLFLGPVDDRRLWELYAGADIVCVPSRYESFGLVLTEAMMFGKPIVASAVGGMPGVVEEGGNALLVPAGDGDRLAACLHRLISSPVLRSNFGRRSRELYEERYTTGRMGDRKAEHFRTIVEAERQRSDGASADPRSIYGGLAGALEEVTGMEPAVASRAAGGLLGAPTGWRRRLGRRRLPSP
jgi:glycogen(starch) synthase